MGRRPTISKEKIERIVHATKLGATRKIAANYAGIGKTALYEWLARGRVEKGTIYAELAEAVQAAEGEAGVEWLNRIEQAASNGSWQAAAWKLERRYPDDYARKYRNDPANTGDAVVTVRIGKAKPALAAETDDGSSTAKSE